MGLTALCGPLPYGESHRDEAGDFGKKGTEEWMAFFEDLDGKILALMSQVEPR